MNEIHSLDRFHFLVHLQVKHFCQFLRKFKVSLAGSQGSILSHVYNLIFGSERQKTLSGKKMCKCVLSDMVSGNKLLLFSHG